MAKIKIAITIFTLSSIFLLNFIFTNTVFAETATVNTGGTSVNEKPVSQPIPKLINPLKSDFGGSIENLILSLVDLAIFAGTILVVFVFIWIGFKFVMAQGDPGAINEAKEWFLYAVIGTALLISSKVIVEIVKNTLISAGVVDERIFKR